MTALIETRGLSKHYGEFRALENVSIAVNDGEIVSIVGPGKHAFWKTPAKLSVETYSIAQNVPDEIVKRIETARFN